MSLLRPHIRAARAYAQAWRDRANLLPEDRDHWTRCIEQCDIHENAALIMEAELAAEYATPAAS